MPVLTGRFGRSAAFRRLFEDVLAALDADPPPAGMGISGWLDARGRTSAPGPASMAAEWWSATQADAHPRHGGAPPTARLSLIGRSFIVVERHPAARWLVVDLGRALDDEGLLDGPFDERSATGTGPVNPYEPGPSRLAALVTLAGYATEIRHARRRHWRDRAVAEVIAHPGSAAALPEPVRNLLPGLGQVGSARRWLRCRPTGGGAGGSRAERRPAALRGDDEAVPRGREPDRERAGPARER